MDRRRERILEDALGDATVRDRYLGKVHEEAGHLWWSGATMRSGHGRFWLGRDRGRDVVVLAHRFSFALAHGLDALLAAPVLRHTCDEPLCQDPEHLAPSEDDYDNRIEWLIRRHRIGSPLRDVRGRAGRARAIRDGRPVEAVMREGLSQLDRDQPTLFDHHEGDTMICPPCQEPHYADDCIDNSIDPPRAGVARHCYCQHEPRRDGRTPGGASEPERPCEGDESAS